jgi:uncharacterized protein YukE
MILSGHLHHDRHSRTAAARLTDRLADIDARRRVAERSVDALLASWQGGAALHQQSGWQDWDLAANDVIDSLSALIGTLDLAREELTDARAQASVPHPADPRADARAERRAGPGVLRLSDLDRRTGGGLSPAPRPRSGT